MNKEEKTMFAKNFYEKIGLENYDLKNNRDDEINADYFYVSDMRGPGGLIIGDDGSYLFCQSAHDYSYYKEEYKKGVRSN